MSKRGRPPRPVLAAVREGNPGHRKRRDPVVLPPAELVEPEWGELLPGDDAESVRVRQVAAGTWARTALTLARSVGLTAAQQDTLLDFCVIRARVDQGERALSRQGVVMDSDRDDRGQVKNPWTTVLNQYRTHSRALASELALTPTAASRIIWPAGAGAGDEDDPFDD